LEVVLYLAEGPFAAQEPASPVWDWWEGVNNVHDACVVTWRIVVWSDPGKMMASWSPLFHSSTRVNKTPVLVKYIPFLHNRNCKWIRTTVKLWLAACCSFRQHTIPVLSL